MMKRWVRELSLFDSCKVENFFFVRELVLIVLKHAEEEQCTSMPVYLSSNYITNIYISFINQAILHISTVLIYFYPRVQSIASFLTFFSLYHLNMKSKEKFPVDCHCKVNMYGCDIFYRISYLLLTV